MARYRGLVCKLCRREGEKLFLKDKRCIGEKCAFERRNYRPGQHGQVKPKFSGYGIQLREKQKVKRIYGILERQFHSYFVKADKMKGITGENLLVFLERRLDNLVTRLGFAGSRAQARQFIRHGHISVNNKRVNIPSYLVRKGDVIVYKEKSCSLPFIMERLKAIDESNIPSWLAFDKAKNEAKVISLPVRNDVSKIPINENLIVELYSR